MDLIKELAMLACGLQMPFHCTPVKLGAAANRFIAAVFLVQHSAVGAQQIVRRNLFRINPSYQLISRSG